MQVVLDAQPEVVADPMGTCWIKLPGQSQCVRLHSRQVEDWISGLAWDGLGELVPSSMIQQVLRVLRSKARQATPTDLRDSEAWQILLQEPCLQVLQEFVHRQKSNPHECTSSEFYKQLSALADEQLLSRGGRDWPKSPAALTRKLKAFESTLRALGIEFFADHTFEGSVITLRVDCPARPDESVVMPSGNASAPTSLVAKHIDANDETEPQSNVLGILRSLLPKQENTNVDSSTNRKVAPIEI